MKFTKDLSYNSGSLIFRCSKCELKSYNRFLILLHLRKDHDLWPEYCQCSFKGCTFRTVENIQMDIHVRENHFDDQLKKLPANHALVNHRCEVKQKKYFLKRGVYILELGQHSQVGGSLCQDEKNDISFW